MKSRPKIKPHQTTLIVAALATLVGFLLPVVQKILLPLQYLNTHLHEFSHAMVAILTGAEVEKIIVNVDGSGVTPVRGGSLLLVASAGYLGASLFGAAMIYFAKTEKGAKSMLGLLSALLFWSLVVWVRGDVVGEAAGIGWVFMLGLLAYALKGQSLMFCAQILGLQQCLNSVRSLFTLVQLSTSTEVHSDATILYQASGIPPMAWAIGWSGFSLALVVWTLRKSWSPASRRAG